MHRTDLVAQLLVTSGTCEVLDERRWADLMRAAAAKLKEDGETIHHLNEQLLNARAELQHLQHVINNR